jgi:hypothetical protein
MTDETKPKRLVSAEWIMERIQKGKDVRLKNAVIKGDLDIKRVNLTKENEKFLVNCSIKIINSTIEKKVNLSNTIFNQPINFESTQFIGVAYFCEIGRAHV